MIDHHGCAESAPWAERLLGNILKHAQYGISSHWRLEERKLVQIRKLWRAGKRRGEVGRGG